MPCLALASLGAGCGTLENGRGWGQDATLLPGWERVGRAALHNARRPWTWAPLALAGVLTIDRWDQEISEWAREEQPLFGSTEDADQASDNLRDVSRYLYLGTALMTESGERFWPWLGSKAGGLAVGFAGKELTSAATSYLKDAFERTRPNEMDDESMPSGHTSSAFAWATLSSRNLDSIDMPDALVTPARIGIYGVGVGTAWARIEAGEHYPTDVLVSMALASFLSGFVHDAFLGLQAPWAPEIGVTVDETLGPALTLSWTR